MKKYLAAKNRVGRRQWIFCCVQSFEISALPGIFSDVRFDYIANNIDSKVFYRKPNLFHPIKIATADVEKFLASK